MSTPRPSEEDVEALTRMVPYEDGTGGWLFRTATTSEVHARLVDWLAARDAEHEREVVGAAAIGRVLDLDGQVQQARLRAEAAERALADRDAAIKAVREFCEEHQRQWNPGMEKAQQFTFDGGVGAAAQDVLALLSRDDTAGAGGAE